MRTLRKLPFPKIDVISRPLIGLAEKLFWLSFEMSIDSFDLAISRGFKVSRGGPDLVSA